MISHLIFQGIILLIRPIIPNRQSIPSLKMTNSKSKNLIKKMVTYCRRSRIWNWTSTSAIDQVLMVDHPDKVTLISTRMNTKRLKSNWLNLGARIQNSSINVWFCPMKIFRFKKLFLWSETRIRQMRLFSKTKSTLSELSIKSLKNPKKMRSNTKERKFKDLKTLWAMKFLL